MDYQIFKEELKSELSDSLEARGYEVRITDRVTHKANHDMDGMTVQLDSADVSPTIYTESTFEQFKESNMSLHDVAENLADTIETAYRDYDTIRFDPREFNAEYVRDNSYLTVVNTEMNTALLSQVPHEEVFGTDLTVYAKVSVGDNASITITNDHAFQLGMTGTEILSAARDNTLNQEFSVRTMLDTLAEMMPEEMAKEILPAMEEEQNLGMCVITNESRVEGANAILSTDTLDEACKKMGCESVVIIPSSRHELLAVNPEINGQDTSAIKDVVEEVNATQVELEDKLSDNIYQYNSTTHELTMCDEKGLFHEEVDIEAQITVEVTEGIGMGR